MSRKYKFHTKERIYFISFATVFWIDVFTRLDYFEIMLGTLRYCRENKGMAIFGYCIMPSHIHLIFRSETSDPSGLIRDLKGYSSRKLLKEIEENAQESRREWLLEKFEEAGMAHSNVTQFQFWQHHNKPIEIWTAPVCRQKLDYMHNNPVLSGLVTQPEH